MPLRTTSASSRGSGIKNLFIRVCSIFVVIIVIFSILIPMVSVGADTKGNKWYIETQDDGVQIIHYIPDDKDSWDDEQTVDLSNPGKGNFWGTNYLYSFLSSNVGKTFSFSTSEMTETTYNALVDHFVAQTKALGNTYIQSGGGYAVPEGSTVYERISYFPGLLEAVEGVLNGDSSAAAVVGETELEEAATVEISYYTIITGQCRADSRSIDDVFEFGSSVDFTVSSGTNLKAILDDTDDAFKALMVGAVGSSYAGALKSVIDVTDQTKEKLEINLDGTHTVRERGQTHVSTADESLATIHDILYRIFQRVIIPVAGIVLAFVFAYQIYEAVCEQNNMNSMGSGFFIQLIVRTCVVILVILFAWELVEAVFDIGQWIVRETSAVVDDVIADNDGLLVKVEQYILENPQYTEDEVLIWTIAYYMCINASIDFGATLAMLTQGIIINLGMYVISVVIFIIVYVRLIEMYIHCCVAPIPLATMVNATWQQVGMNFIRSIAALALQGFILYLCIAVFEVLVSRMINEETLLSTSFASSMWEVIGFAIVLVFCMFKSSSISKSIVAAR